MRYNIATGVRHVKTRTQKILMGTIALAFPAVMALANGGASAVPSSSYSITPWTYNPQLCPGLVSQWDNSVGNPPPSLHLTKPCPTATNASSGATVNGVSGITLTELNFDYKSDGHCGAGAPRYNVVTTDGVTHFFGCLYGVHTNLGNGWTHVEFSPADSFPPVTPGEVVQSIDIVFDEGTDIVGQGTPGSVYLDNFSINGQVIGGPTSKDACKDGGWMQFANPSFKNQGDCVSYFATNGKNQPSGQ